MHDEWLAAGDRVALRRVSDDDLEQIVAHPYSVHIAEPLDELDRLREVYSETGFWQLDAMAVAIIDPKTGRLIGTAHSYRGAPCIHGLELGYIVHDAGDRSQGYASEAVRLFSDYLFANVNWLFRQQLLIEVWNTASWKVAERTGFTREGILRSSGFGSGDPADSFIYSRVRRDFAQAMASMNGPG